MGSLDDPAISYSTTAPHNAVVEVNKKLRDGAVPFAFDGRRIPGAGAGGAADSVESQLLVVSRTSWQARRINEQNRRALFFSDGVAPGWVRGGDVIEMAARDESAGIVFYTLEQRADVTAGPPQFKGAFVCLGCLIFSLVFCTFHFDHGGTTLFDRA